MPGRISRMVPRMWLTPRERATADSAKATDAGGLTPQELIHKRTLFLLPSKDPFSAVLTGEAKQVR